MLILLTNDDGYLAPGIKALNDALSEIAEVYIVAPDRERSAVSMAITLTDPLRAWPFQRNGMKGHFVNGTPADCVKLGCGALLDKKPDYIFSGINQGSNVGLNANYSGTIAAAVEGAMLGIPSVAVSLSSFSSRDFQGASKSALAVLDLLQETPINPYEILSINVPAIPESELKGIKVSRVGHCLYREVFDRRYDARDREYYWMGGQWTEFEDVEDSDSDTVSNGYVSVTPLRVDWTAGKTFEKLKQNGWDQEWSEH